MEIQYRESLIETMLKQDYDVIAIWPDGDWAAVDTSYAGEQSGDDPIAFLSRVDHYKKDRRQLEVLLDHYEDIAEFL